MPLPIDTQSLLLIILNPRSTPPPPSHDIPRRRLVSRYRWTPLLLRMMVPVKVTRSSGRTVRIFVVMIESLVRALVIWRWLVCGLEGETGVHERLLFARTFFHVFVGFFVLRVHEAELCKRYICW